MTTRITGLSIENIKKIKAIELTPDRNIVAIGGNNDQGKSSTLDAIMMALGGKRVQTNAPVRKGAGEGTIELTLDNGIKITKKIKEDGKEQLVVEDSDGRYYRSPQALLDSLFNKHCFDPLSILGLSKGEQYELVSSIAGVDLQAEDLEYKSAYEERTRLSREVDRLSGFLSENPVDQRLQSAPISTYQLAEELARASNSISQVRGLETEYRILVDNEKDRVAKLNALTEELANIAERKKSLKGRLDSMPIPNLEEINQKIANVERENQKIELNNKARAALEERAQLLEQAEELTEKLKSIKERRKNLDNSLNVDGLSFENGELIYQGVPLANAGQATRIKVLTSLVMSANTELGVILIKDASLLDETNWETIKQIAVENDYQIFLELVGEDDRASVIIEDGEIKGAPMGKPGRGRPKKNKEENVDNVE